MISMEKGTHGEVLCVQRPNSVTERNLPKADTLRSLLSDYEQGQGNKRSPVLGLTPVNSFLGDSAIAGISFETGNRTEMFANQADQSWPFLVEATRICARIACRFENIPQYRAQQIASFA
jgi:hypothetical protein